MAKNSKEHILEVSLVLFLQKSFKAVTMKEIVQKTGLSKGAFYHYFDSKEKVFEEVMKYFYADLFKQNFDEFSHESLRAFCKDYLKDIDKKFLSVRKMEKSTGEIMNVNHYFLIFDAFTLLPAFKEKHKKDEQEEIQAWKKIVRIAREKGEIKSELKDEDIAKMYLYLGDGFGMHVILENNLANGPKFMKGIEKLFNNLYQLIQA